MSLPNHEQLKELFENNPEAFERERARLISEHISSSPAETQERLKEAQKNLDNKLG